MKFGFPGGPRLEWYDRNPQVKAIAYKVNTIAPHGAATRVTYTVPAGKKAFIENLQLIVQRQVAAAPVGFAWAQFSYTPSGGTLLPILLARINTNNVGDKDSAAVGNAGILLAGDMLEGQTCDDSTGGSCNYLIAAKIMEFDA